MADQLGTLLENIFVNLRNRSYRPEILRKLKMRMLNQSFDLDASRESEKWCRERAQDFASLATSLDARLWQETKTFSGRFAERARSTLKQFNVDLGGGGFYPLLYFVTRYRRPNIVVETGVAAGFSSHAILAAMQPNGHGHLYSSDFPNFRLHNPESFVGVLGDKELRSRWSFSMLGDRRNIPELLKEVSAVDMFHYDSDKSYSGRDFALRSIGPVLSAQSVVVMDVFRTTSSFGSTCASENVPLRCSRLSKSISASLACEKTDRAQYLRK